MMLSRRWKVARKTGERFWILLCTFVSFVGISLCYLGSQGRFALTNSNFIHASFFAFGQTLSMCSFTVMGLFTMTLASKVVPPASKQLMMPWVSSCSAAGRLTGPMWTQWTYSVQNLGQQTEVVFGSMLVCCVISMRLCIVFWKVLVADSWRIKSIERTIN